MKHAEMCYTISDNQNRNFRIHFYTMGDSYWSIEWKCLITCDKGIIIEVEFLNKIYPFSPAHSYEWMLFFFRHYLNCDGIVITKIF